MLKYDVSVCEVDEISSVNEENEIKCSMWASALLFRIIILMKLTRLSR